MIFALGSCDTPVVPSDDDSHLKYFPHIAGRGPNTEMQVKFTVKECEQRLVERITADEESRVAKPWLMVMGKILEFVALRE